MTPTWLGQNEGENYLMIRLAEEKKKKYSIVAKVAVEKRNDVDGGDDGDDGGKIHSAVVTLQITFKCGNITQTFVHGHNAMPFVTAATDVAKI